MPIFIPFELPRSRDGKYIAGLLNDRILFNRRDRLGLTQQEVADIAGIPLRQYQRLESGEADMENTPMSIGLAVCAALLLDPYYLVGDYVNQPDPATLKPQEFIDVHKKDVKKMPKRVGRKPIRREIMTVYVNHDHYSAIIPKEVVEALGKPHYIKLFWVADERRLLFCAAEQDEDGVFDVPGHLYDESFKATALVFPAAPSFSKVRKDLNWDSGLYAVECQKVHDEKNRNYILCDLNTAQPSEKIAGPFVIPSCIDDGSDDYDIDEEESTDEEAEE